MMYMWCACDVHMVCMWCMWCMWQAYIDRVEDNQGRGGLIAQAFAFSLQVTPIHLLVDDDDDVVVVVDDDVVVL